MGTWASARNIARRQGSDDPDEGPDDPAIVRMIREGARMIRLHMRPSGVFGRNYPDDPKGDPDDPAKPG